MKNSYAQAMVEMINQGYETNLVLKRVKAIMVKHGHQNLYHAVLKATLVILEKQATAKTPSIVLTKTKDATHQLVAKALAQLAVDDAKPTIVVDDTLIGGAIVKYKHHQIDLSYKNSLIKLYQATTT